MNWTGSDEQWAMGNGFLSHTLCLATFALATLCCDGPRALTPFTSLTLTTDTDGRHYEVASCRAGGRAGRREGGYLASTRVELRRWGGCERRDGKRGL